MTSAAFQGQTNLLVLQATPFCNINCSYCYLPNRSDRSRMSIETAVTAVKWVVEEGLAPPELTIAWHAGEPLVVPPDWYREAFTAVQQAAGTSCAINHAIQTNGLLINDDWCDLFLDANVSVGISIDGPRELHDTNRVTRSGRGTHEAAMRGIETLKRRRVPFHVIAVVGESTAKASEAFITFMSELGAQEIGINFEELEGHNTQTSLDDQTISPAMLAFLKQLVDYASTHPEFQLREMRHVVAALCDRRFRKRRRNSENSPFRIVTVDSSGGLYTFSPELAGQRDPAYQNFRLGSIWHDSLAEILSREPYLSLEQDISTGVRECRNSCSYFAVCMGGAPSNKIAELGRMTGTETISCRHSVMAFSETILMKLELDLSV